MTDMKQACLDALAKHGVTFDGNVAKTSTLICPVCDGGRHRDKSFVVWYTPPKIMYKCYRGKCGIGNSFNIASDGVEVTASAPPIRSLYYGNMRRIQHEEEFRYICEKYHSSALTQHLIINDRCGRLGVLLRSQYGAMWGVELKNWRNISDLPKSSRKYLSVRDTKNNLAWARTERSFEVTPKYRTLYVTEDAISAYRIMQDCDRDAVALLGTHLRTEDAELMLGAGFQRLRLVLDPDEAGMKGMRKIMNSFGFMFDISTHRLPDDPKDLEPTVLRQEIEKIE